MIPVARPHFGEEEERAVAEVLRSGWVAQGPTTRAFEEEFASWVGVPHAVAASSCTTALHLAMVAVGVGPGDEVILPAFTFPATANAVLYCGATPVLVDVERDSLNIDADRVAEAVTPRTKAIVGVHLFGGPCEMPALEEIAAERGIAVLEDAACAAGTEIDGRRAGTFGRMACFSFHARKVITCGEGGMITLADDDDARRLRSLRTHGADVAADTLHASGAAPPTPRHVDLGYNYRLSDLQAAVGRVQLARLPGFLDERRRLAAAYDGAFRELPGLRLPPRAPGRVHSYQSYVVVLEASAPVSPAEFRDSLAEAGISTRIGTYSVHREPYAKTRVVTPHPLPVSEEAGERAVALPFYNGLLSEDRDRVVGAVQEVWKRILS